MRLLRQLFLVICFAVAAGFGFTGCSTYDATRMVDRSAALRPATSGLVAEVNALAQPLIESGEFHSLSIGVLTADGVTQHFAFAPSDAPEPQADTIFEIGSVTKPFVATLLAILVQEGALRYDETVREILPTHLKLTESLGNVTLLELATHTAGLPLHPQPVAKWPYFLDFAFSGRNPYRYITRPYLYRYLRTCDVPPKVERGYDYSNLGYGLLGHLIEIKTRRTLPELMVEKIFRPLNMRDTTFTLTAAQRKRLAIGRAGDEPTFIRRNRPVPDWEMGEIMRASGGLYSTSADLLKFAQAHLGLSGQSLDAHLTATHRVQLDTPLQRITLAWVVERTENFRPTTLSRIGVVAGYCAFLGFDTEKRVAVTVLGNNFNWTDKIGHKLLTQLCNPTPSSQSLAKDARRVETSALP